MDSLAKPQDDKFYEFKAFRVPKYRIEFQRAGKLEDIPGYVWYTPAALYLYGRYTDTNLADLVQLHNLKIFWYKFEKPIFNGFKFNEDSSWNHVLWAASTEQWGKLVDGILESVQFDLKNSKLYQYALQQLTIYDPLAVDVQRVVSSLTPTVKVHAFAVLSNEKQYAFDVRNKDVRLLPAVSSFKPDPLHVMAAQRLFSSPGMTQDKAFNRYKEILVSEQDAEYRRNNMKKGTS